MNVSPRQLRIFTYLAQTLSFRATAERFGVTQPTMSRIVHDLETELGARLFERTTRRVKLSREGRELYEIAARLSQDFDDGLSELAQVARRRAQRISVAALPTLAALLLAEPLARFRATRPEVIIKVEDVYAEAAIELLRQRTVDFALSSIGPRQDDLEYEALTEERFVLMVSKAHYGQIDLKNWSASAIDGIPVIAMRRGTSTRNNVDAAFRHKGLNFRPYLELQHLSSIAHFVLSGFGLTILPTSATQIIGDDRMLVMPIDDVTKRVIGIISRKGSKNSKIAREFVSEMRKGLHLLGER